MPGAEDSTGVCAAGAGVKGVGGKSAAALGLDWRWSSITMSCSSAVRSWFAAGAGVAAELPGKPVGLGTPPTGGVTVLLEVAAPGAGTTVRCVLRPGNGGGV